MQTDITCARCGHTATLTGKRGQISRYCSRECRRQHSKELADSLGRTLPGQPKGNIGAYSELLVALDLMRRGYHVFRAVGPHGPFDLVAWRKDTGLLRVEVKTGVRFNGQATLPIPPEPVEWDRIAFAFHDGVVYWPSAV